MPWTVDDVEAHNKGLSDSAKKRWVAVANSVRAKCLADGGKEGDCDASAIRQANGVVKGNEEELETDEVTLTPDEADDYLDYLLSLDAEMLKKIVDDAMAEEGTDEEEIEVDEEDLELYFDPEQKRAPAGSSIGGQWISESGLVSEGSIKDSLGGGPGRIKLMLRAWGFSKKPAPGYKKEKGTFFKQDLHNVKSQYHRVKVGKDASWEYDALVGDGKSEGMFSGKGYASLKTHLKQNKAAEFKIKPIKVAAGVMAAYFGKKVLIHMIKVMRNKAIKIKRERIRKTMLFESYHPPDDKGDEELENDDTFSPDEVLDEELTPDEAEEYIDYILSIDPVILKQIIDDAIAADTAKNEEDEQALEEDELELNYDPNQPRAPEGTSIGGRFVPKAGTASDPTSTFGGPGRSRIMLSIWGFHRNRHIKGTVFKDFIKRDEYAVRSEYHHVKVDNEGKWNYEKILSDGKTAQAETGSGFKSLKELLKRKKAAQMTKGRKVLIGILAVKFGPRIIRHAATIVKAPIFMLKHPKHPKKPKKSGPITEMPGTRETGPFYPPLLKQDDMVNLIIHYDSLSNNESPYRTETHMGREHLVVPVIMMVEGVHAGSHGPLYHPADELGQFIGAWNGIPVVVQHPQIDGVAVSANSPEIIEQKTVGRVYNAHMDGVKLLAEAWIDIEKLNAVHKDTLDMIKNQKELDVSVGVFTKDDLTPGTWNGEKYIGVARGHRPDHLALLPGGTGACSWKDGCGVRINEAEGGETNLADNEITVTLNLDTKPFLKGLDDVSKALSSKGYFLVQGDKSFFERIDAVRQKLGRMDDDVKIHFLNEIYDKYFIYEVSGRNGAQYNGAGLYRRDYTVNKDGTVEFTGEPISVRREINYVANSQEGVTVMPEEKDKKKKCACPEKVKALIDNEHTPYQEADRPWLEEQEDTRIDQLITMAQYAEKEPEKVVEKVIEKVVEPITNEQAVQVLREQFKTPEQFIGLLPEEMREQMTSALKLHQQKRAELVEAVKKHSKFTDDQLKTKTMHELDILADMARQKDYSGMSGGAPQVNSDVDILLPPPGLIVNKEGGK